TTDRTGTLYMADTTSLVIRDNRLGGKQQTIDMRLRLLDIKFDSRDRLVGISSEENCVVRVNDNSGAGFVRYGGKGSGPGKFSMPEGIAIDSKDRIYIADSANHRIVRIDDLNGSGWVSYGSYGSGVGQFNFPRGIFIDRRDRIYVADTYNPRIVRIDDMNGSGWATYGETAETRMD